MARNLLVPRRPPAHYTRPPARSRPWPGPLPYNACSLQSPTPASTEGVIPPTLSSAGGNVADKSEIALEGRVLPAPRSRVKGVVT